MCNRTSTRFLGFVLVGLSAISVHAREGRLELGPAYYEIRTDVETPHLKWGKPLAGGPIKALIVAPRGRQRETVELWQRLEMEYTAIVTPDATTLGHPPDDLSFPSGGSVQATETRLRQAMLGNYDVIVLGISWTALPAEVATALVTKVRNGAGLVLAVPGELAKEQPAGEFKAFMDSWKEIPRPAWVLAGSRLDELPHYSKVPPEKIFTCYAAGPGRVALVNPAGSGWTYLVPDVGETPGAGRWEFEDQQAFATKLLLWAAGRAPAVSLTNLELVVPQSSIKEALVGSDRRADRPLATRRARRSRPTLGTETDEAPAADGIGLRLTATGATGYRVSCQLTIRDRWGDVLTETSGGWMFNPAEASHDFPLPPLKGGVHRAEVRLLDLQGAAQWWGVWRIKVTPKFGLAKVMLDTDEVPAGRPVTGRIELAGPPVPKARLVYRITDAYGRLVAQTETKAKSGTFAVLDPHPLAVYHELAVRLMSGEQILDEQHVRFATPLKGPGWDDFSFVLWHHTTENWIGRLINRELQGKYWADALNCAAWQTPERIEDIHWLVAEDGLWTTPYVAHCGNYWGGTGLVRAPCLSAPDFIKGNTERMREVGRRVRKFCPAGYDLGDENTLVSDETDVCFSPDCQASFRVYLKERYPSLAALNAEWGTQFKDWAEVSPITKAEALAKGQVPRWVDHRMHMNSVFADTHRRWRDAIREFDPQARVGFEGPVGLPGYNGHDLWQFSKFMDFWGAYPYAHQWYEALHSFAPKGSYGGVWFGGYPDTRYWFHNWPWTAALRGLCAVWWWPTYGCNACDALAGDLRPYPDFLATVEKDIRPLKTGLGKLIMHAQPDTEPVAVHHSIESVYARLAYAPTNAPVHYPVALGEAGVSFRLIAPEQIVAGQLSKFRVLLLPGSLALSDAEAVAIRQFVENGGLLIADQQPGITDEHGKRRAAGALDSLLGTERAILLNDKTTLASILQARGFVPPVTVIGAKGQVVDKPTLFRDGDAMLVAFSGDGQRATHGDVVVHLPKPAWCYVAGENQCLGHTDRPKVITSETQRYRVLVGLPYKVTGLTAKRQRESSTRAQRFVFNLKTDGGPPGFHVLRITVAGPDGRDRACYAANLSLTNGRGEHIVPLALNDPRGDWRLTATDVISGAQVAITWTESK